MCARRILFYMIAFAILLSPLSSHARKLYIAVITVDGTDTLRKGTNSILSVTEFFDNTSLEELFPDYTPNSGVFSRIDFRGVGAILTLEQNSTKLTFAIPGTDFSVSFEGDTRDESQEQFEDWLKGDFESPEAPKQSLTILLQILVELSPVDPVAGNPNSLMTRMFLADFEQGITGPFISSNSPLPGQKNYFSISADVGFFNADVFSGEFYNLPINYRWNLKSRPKLSLIVDFPITLTRTETAWSYLASLGLGAQYRPTKWWSLTPMGRVGGVGSFDVGALAVLFSGSITNYFHYSFPNTHLGWGSMGGITTTLDGIKINDWDLSYDLTNYVWRNGGDVTQKTGWNMFGNPLGFKFFLNHTKFWGNALYIESFFDMGIGLVTIDKIGYAYAEKIGLSFTFSIGADNDYENYGFKLTYRF